MHRQNSDGFSTIENDGLAESVMTDRISKSRLTRLNFPSNGLRFWLALAGQRVRLRCNLPPMSVGFERRG